MAITAKSGQTLTIKVARTINRDAGRKTIQRLFCKDKSVMKPLDARSANFIPIPKRRGGCIWTKRVNKVHPDLSTGQAATIVVTPQLLRDLASVENFLEISAA